MLWRLMVIVWLALAPTWKTWRSEGAVEQFQAVELGVCAAMRLISAISCLTSACRAARSEALLVALADWTASSRIRCRVQWPFAPSAPSPVCASEMPSLALRVAWLRPRIWVVKRSEMPRPAASSLALLMRRPEDRRCREVDSADCECSGCAASSATGCWY